MKRLTVIDLDSIIYLIAYNNKDERLSMVIEQNVEAFIKDILEATEAEAYAGFYQKSGHKNYRRDFFSGYKSNRPEKPEFIKQWGQVIMDKFETYTGFTGLEVIESDDALSIFANKYKDLYEVTFAHIDKDLNCIPGLHYNYRSGEKYTVGTQDALFFAKCQVLSGDSGDGIPGVPGIGKVKAKSFVEKYNSLEEAYGAASITKGIIQWKDNFYRDYNSINLLDTLEELKQFTNRREVDIFVIDDMEYEEEIYIPEAGPQAGVDSIEGELEDEDW